MTPMEIDLENEMMRRAIESSLFLSSYEILKTTIIRLPKIFFGVLDINRSGMPEKIWLEINQEYTSSIEKYAKNYKEQTKSHFLWLKENDFTKSIFSDDDFEILTKLIDLRNYIAHQNFEYILAGTFDSALFFDIRFNFIQMTALHRKLSFWELKNIEQQQYGNFLNEDDASFKTTTLLVIELFYNIIQKFEIGGKRVLN